MDDGLEGLVRSVPTLVAVHRVVAARDGGDPVGRQLGEVVDGRGRRDVAAVGERVDPRLLGSEAEQGFQVVDVRMDAAVGDEPEQVRALAALEGADEGGDLEEGPVLDRRVHSHQVLQQDAAGADRQVPDLRVAHLPRRKADRLAGCLERRVRVLGPEPVEDGRVRELDRVSRAGRGEAPPVEDDERYERVPARQIAANDSTSSEAPPTSAPSTSGCPSSSAAFSGFTEPP